MWDAVTGDLLVSFPYEGCSGCSALSPDALLIGIGEIGNGGGIFHDTCAALAIL